MRTWLMIALVAGCQKETADEGWTCQDTPTTIGMSDPTALGFTAEAALAHATASESATLTYADATTTPLTLGFASAGTARFVDSEPVYEGDGDEVTLIEIDCFDRVEVAGTFTFVTDDGLFDESFDASLSATVAEEATISASLDLDALGGTFEIEPFVDTTDPWDDARAWIQATFVAGVSRGVVDGQVSGSDPDCEAGDACTAWAAQVAVGTWGAVEE